MRRRTPLAFAGILIVALGAVIGFASFTAERESAISPGETVTASTPDIVSGRLTAAILSSRLSPIHVVSDTTEPTTTAVPAVEATSQATTPPDASPSIRSTTVATTIVATTLPPPSPTTTTPPPTVPITQPPVVFQESVERWRPLVATYFPTSLLDEALSVMACESKGDPNAQNPNSTAGGLYQFIASTWNWASANAGFAGVSVYDPEANIATAAFLVEYAIDRDLPPWQHWVCQPSIDS